APAALKFNSGITKTSTEGIFSTLTLKLPIKIMEASVKEISNLSGYLNTGTALPMDDRNAAINISSDPGPQYQTNLKPVPGARYYEIKVPSGALKGLNDI